jgi:hypothetical protein
VAIGSISSSLTLLVVSVILATWATLTVVAGLECCKLSLRLVPERIVNWFG